jgi:peptide/nickel transport system permease protein
MRHFSQRCVTGLAVVFGVVTLTFFLLHAAPGDPVVRLLGPAATTPQLAAGRHALGLDRPLTVQYASWLADFVRGRWGTSITTGRPVAGMLADAWPNTALLVLLSIVCGYLIGIAVGAVQAMRQASRLDTSLSVATVTLYALPGFWLGLMLVMVFTYWLRVLPAFGVAGVDADYLSGWGRALDRVRHLALPLATLTLIGIGGTARYARGAMLDVLREPFIVTARAKGLPVARITRRHVARPALTPLVTLLGLSLPALFSGAVFIEAVFAWPGVGRILVEAVAGRDYPVVMAGTAVSAILVVIGNLVADLLAQRVDPRHREAM